jgi:hypothetical protein
MDELVNKYKIKRERIIKHYIDNKPDASLSTTDNQQNRRVDIILIKKK